MISISQQFSVLFHFFHFFRFLFIPHRKNCFHHNTAQVEPLETSSWYHRQKHTQAIILHAAGMGWIRRRRTFTFFSLILNIIFFSPGAYSRAVTSVRSTYISKKSYTTGKKAHSLARSRFSSVLAIWISIEHNTARKHRKAGERIDFPKKLQKNSKNSKKHEFSTKTLINLHQAR